MVEYKSGIFSTLFFCLSITIPLPTSLSFDFYFLDPAGLSAEIELQGVAIWSGTDGIQLTNNTVTNGVGRAVYREPMLLMRGNGGNFTTLFNFSIESSEPNAVTNASGNGLAFFLSPYSSTFAVNSPRVTVEFDIFQNNDCTNYVGTGSDSIMSKNVTLRTCLKDGSQATARVSYDAGTRNFSVLLTYADAQVSGGSSSLSVTTDLRDVLPEKVTVGFSAAAGDVAVSHTILSWSFNASFQQNTAVGMAPTGQMGGPTASPPETKTDKVLLRKKKKSKVGLVISLVIGGSVILVVVLGLLLCFILSRKKSPTTNAEDEAPLSTNAEDEATLYCDQTADDEIEEGQVPQKYRYEVLASAASNFSKERKLGQGGSASVYKGYLEDQKREVAIKRIFSGPEVEQQRKVYISEVKIISRLRHRNLVKLEGWCHHRGECLLVYEFMANGSLDSYLYSADKILEWPVRHRIALGLADALLYLHEGCEQCVLHRDIKPSNIMLDSAFNAKLGDFGLARLVDHDHDLKTTKVAGTFGYLAPEYYTTGKASKESDVFSFGIVALAIACGRRSVDHREQQSKEVLVEWVRELHGRRTILDAADPKLNGNFDKKEMERLLVVGLWCARPDCKLRPSIRQAINALKLETPLPDHLPPQMPLPAPSPLSDGSQSQRASSIATN